MKNGIKSASSVFLALMALGSPNASAQQDQARPGQGQYDSTRARPRDLDALEDDLRVLDDALAAVPPRNPRHQEFTNRAGDIRNDVSALADRIRNDQPGWRDGRGGSREEIDALRQRIAVLRGDLEDAQAPWRGGRDYIVPAGTTIDLILDQTVSSRYSNVEDRVEASTADAIRGNRRTFLPAGASVSGFVREIRSREHGQRDAFVRLDFDAITPQNGSRIPMSSHVVAVSEHHTHDKTLKSGGIGALLGGVLGGIVGGKEGLAFGAAIGAGGGLVAAKGSEVELPEGSLVTIRLDRALTIPRR